MGHGLAGRLSQVSTISMLPSLSMPSMAVLLWLLGGQPPAMSPEPRAGRRDLCYTAQLSSPRERTHMTENPSALIVFIVAAAGSVESHHPRLIDGAMISIMHAMTSIMRVCGSNQIRRITNQNWPTDRKLPRVSTWAEGIPRYVIKRGYRLRDSMARGMGDLEEALWDMDAAAPALATAGGEQNELIPADPHAHLMGGGAIARIGAKLNPVLKWSVYYNWLLMVVSMLSLTNHLFPKNQTLITPILTLISLFVVFLAAICLMFRAVIKQTS